MTDAVGRRVYCLAMATRMTSATSIRWCVVVVAEVDLHLTRNRGTAGCWHMSG